MDFKQLFDTQMKLDTRIKKEKGLQGVDLLEEKYLALRVELGELANEWRGFKFWSENQRPNVERWVECKKCDGTGDLNYEIVQEDAEGTGGHEYIDCDECDSCGTSHVTNPLLEEYVDCLHFLLSIGNEYDYSVYTALKSSRVDHTVLHEFNQVFDDIESVKNCMGIHVIGSYEMLFNDFLNLGRLLGFSEEQIEKAYYDKNKTNHERQDNGY